MPITTTDLHRKKMIADAESAVLNLQSSVASNALTHKQLATDQSLTLQQLQARINDSIDAYEQTRSKLRTFRDVTIPADTSILTVGAAIKADIQSVGNVGQEIADHIDIFAAMPRTTLIEIIAACDYLIANVNPPQSIWD